VTAAATALGLKDDPASLAALVCAATALEMENVSAKENESYDGTNALSEILEFFTHFNRTQPFFLFLLLAYGIEKHDLVFLQRAKLVCCV
jgi:hypothetical protein